MFRGEGIKVFYMQDAILFPVYLIILLLFIFLYRNYRYSNSPMKQYFFPGIIIRMIGAMALGVIYLFYYHGGGDTFYYYRDSQSFNYAFDRSFLTFIQLLLVPGNTTTPATYDFTWWLTYFHDPAGWTADKVYGVLSVLSFHSYPVMAIMMACISFTGAWVLLRTFVSMYPTLTNQFAWAILFVPSVFFWGSGVLKDSITFACIGWVTYTTYQIFFRRRKIIGNSIVLIFTAYVALQIKAYIIISFLPATLLWIFLTYRSQIGNKFLRVVSGPLMIGVGLAFGFLMVKTMGKEFEQFSLNEVLATSERFQQWHGYLAENDNASGYSLGTMTGTWQNVLSKFPIAVNVTLFRPYIWEATNPMMLVAALESIFMMGFTIYILYKNGIRRTVSSIVTNPNVFFCFFFAIVFAFAVGFTSYNFGALVRYKIPCIPFYLGGLIILNHLTAVDREKRLTEKEALRKRSIKLGSKVVKPIRMPNLN